MAGEGQEVGAQGVDIGDQVGNVLAGIHHHHGAGGMGGVGDGADRREGAEHVRHGGDAEQPGPVELGLEVRGVEQAVVGHAEVAQLEVQLLGQDEPGHEVGVVLHLGEHNHVPAAQVGPPPG